MHRKKPILRFVVLALYITAVILVGFHSHDDIGSHDDCPLCVAASTSGLADVNNNAIPTFANDIVLRLSFDKVHYVLPCSTDPFSGRAPPSTYPL